VKLHSTTITHKSDVGGVVVNLQDGAAVRGAYEAMALAIQQSHGDEAFAGVTVQEMVPREEGLELIVGSSVDPQFGPVILFGTGGTLVEVHRDSAVALPPLNTTLAKRLMEQTRIYTALRGVRGQGPVDLVGLEQLLVRVSRLVLDHPCIQELDINPLLASPRGTSRPLVALDARILILTGEGEICAAPRPAIRPYPIQYVRPWHLRDGTAVTIRPIRPEDEPLVVAFHRTLSEESIYFRYFHMMSLGARIAHERLIRICFTDYDREMALVVDRRDTATADHSLLAVGRLSRLHGRDEAEFALLVSDPHQHQGLGTELLRILLQIGRDEGLRRISAEILPENHAMQRICQRLGFTVQPSPEVVQAWIDLD
jgi:acetyltransferase